MNTSRKLDSKENLILCYPNPTKDILTISGSMNESFSLTNLTGEKILSGIIDESEYNIHLQELPNGIYLLRIGNKQQKILKQ
jgi:hypothetical protein